MKPDEIREELKKIQLNFFFRKFLRIFLDDFLRKSFKKQQHERLKKSAKKYLEPVTL